MFERSVEFSRTLGVLLAVLVASGCGGGERGAGEGEGAAAEETAAASMASGVDEAIAATIKGQVVFQGTVPEPTVVDMSEEPTCADKYDGPKYSEEVVGNENGTLKNVFVYVKQGLSDRSFPAPGEPVVLDQKGCWYMPRVFGVQVGQDLVIKNSDGVLHNINARAEMNRGFNISQPVVMETTRRFRAPEVMISLQCDVHGWMQAYVGVLEHPYYSVTGADGSFSLAPLPPGTYVIEAWHEKYGTQTQGVTVGENEEAEITFRFGRPSA
jgi:hypothetical protein